MDKIKRFNKYHQNHHLLPSNLKKQDQNDFWKIKKVWKYPALNYKYKLVIFEHNNKDKLIKLYEALEKDGKKYDNPNINISNFFNHNFKKSSLFGIDKKNNNNKTNSIEINKKYFTEKTIKHNYLYKQWKEDVKQLCYLKFMRKDTYKEFFWQIFYINTVLSIVFIPIIIHWGILLNSNF